LPIRDSNSEPKKSRALIKEPKKSRSPNVNITGLPEKLSNLSKDGTVKGYMRSDKKEKKIFFVYKEILKGSVAESYMTNDLLMYD
jgi:hypothetical protein